MGVSLALKALDSALEKPCLGRLVMFGPIIHNPQVLRFYEKKGVLCLEDPEALHPGDRVIIRAHGIPRHVEAKMRERGVELVDATCPRVKAAQTAIAEATANGHRLFLFGEEHHPEVQGLVSYAHRECFVFSDIAVLATQPVEPGEPLVLAAQTTQDKGAFETIIKEMKHKTVALHVLSTICDATSRRQNEAQELAKKVDAMVIIGGLTSGNTRRLAGIAQNEGVPAFHAESAETLPLQELARFSVIGLTAGASTPRGIIDSAQAKLEALPAAM